MVTPRLLNKTFKTCSETLNHPETHHHQIHLLAAKPFTPPPPTPPRLLTSYYYHPTLLLPDATSLSSCESLEPLHHHLSLSLPLDFSFPCSNPSSSTLFPLFLLFGVFHVNTTRNLTPANALFPRQLTVHSWLNPGMTRVEKGVGTFVCPTAIKSNGFTAVSVTSTVCTVVSSHGVAWCRFHLWGVSSRPGQMFSSSLPVCTRVRAYACARPVEVVAGRNQSAPNRRVANKTDNGSSAGSPYHSRR